MLRAGSQYEALPTPVEGFGIWFMLALWFVGFAPLGLIALLKRWRPEALVRTLARYL